MVYKNKIIKSVTVCLLTLFLLLSCTITPQASDTSDDNQSAITDVEAFEDADTGVSKYIGKDYRDNYTLDMEKIGITEFGNNLSNVIANGAFSINRFISYATVVLFYHSFNFNIADLIGDSLNGIQKALKNGIFDKLFILFFVGCLVYILKQMAKRNLQNIYMQFGKVVVIVAMSFAMVTSSASFLSFVNNAGKEVSVTVISSIAGTDLGSETTMENYALNASTVLWDSLVHKPWVSLEFGNYTPTDEEIDKFLATAPDSTERETAIKELQKEQEDVFKKSSLGYRAVFSIVLVIVNLAKCGIFLILSAIMLAMQIIAVLLVLLAPIMLLMAIPASMGGMRVIGKWLGQIFSVELTIVVMSFILALIIMVDNLIYSKLPFGWLIGMIIQIIISILLVVYRKQIMRMIENIANAQRIPAEIRHGRNGQSGEGAPAPFRNPHKNGTTEIHYYPSVKDLKKYENKKERYKQKRIRQENRERKKSYNERNSQEYSDNRNETTAPQKERGLMSTNEQQKQQDTATRNGQVEPIKKQQDFNEKQQAIHGHNEKQEQMPTSVTQQRNNEIGGQRDVLDKVKENQGVEQKENGHEALRKNAGNTQEQTTRVALNTPTLKEKGQLNTNENNTHANRVLKEVPKQKLAKPNSVPKSTPIQKVESAPTKTKAGADIKKVNDTPRTNKPAAQKQRIQKTNKPTEKSPTKKKQVTFTPKKINANKKAE